MININDKIVMRHTQIEGFICSAGSEFLCSKVLDNDYYEIMSGTDPIIIHKNNISKVYNAVTNAVIFTHDVNSNL